MHVRRTVRLISASMALSSFLGFWFMVGAARIVGFSVAKMNVIALMAVVFVVGAPLAVTIGLVGAHLKRR